MSPTSSTACSKATPPLPMSCSRLFMRSCGSWPRTVWPAKRQGHTLQPTALVHEAWLRLARTPDQNWQNRAHFFRTAAECMRRILIDHARRKQQVRHGGGQVRVSLEGLDLADDHDGQQLLHVNEALDRLAVQDATKAEIVKLRFFAGLENREIAEMLGLSERTVERAWRFAKAWLLAEFNEP